MGLVGNANCGSGTLEKLVSFLDGTIEGGNTLLLKIYEGGLVSGLTMGEVSGG